MDLLLDPATNDLVFDNGKSAVTKDITEAIAQKLKVKLQTFRGEWFLDESYGAPYYQNIFGKNRSKSSVDSIFHRMIAEEEYVQEILEFKSTQTNARQYKLTFRVRDTSGNLTNTITIQTGG